MKRRLFAFLLTFSLLFTLSAQAALDGSALLPRSRFYEEQFADVSADSWYHPYVVAGYEYGLFMGRGDGFEPDAPISLSELLTLSARLRAAYAGDSIPAPAEGEAWDAPYIAYLAEQGLLPATLTDYGADATRAQLAGIFALSLPAECYDGLNDALVTSSYASRSFITDVDEYTPYGAEILWLYRQGLLAGTDATGSYWPERTTTRAEVAAVVTRMADPSLRIALDWVVHPYRSAEGATLASLIEAPEQASSAPDYFDPEQIDAALRQMLAAGENTLTLRYPYEVTESDANTLVHAFLMQVKSYCEQMYNLVICQRYWKSGLATLTFSASGCPGETEEDRAAQLNQYRDETMARAIEVHDMLWETGQLTTGMTQYEVAQVYFRWLCEHCEYDYRAANDGYSLSHIAYNALIHGKAVCDGYTGAYNLFLKLEGIECTALPNETHIWTVATLDGVEYHIDVTWGDQTGRIDERYFGMTAEQSYAAHPW